MIYYYFHLREGEQIKKAPNHFFEYMTYKQLQGLDCRIATSSFWGLLYWILVQRFFTYWSGQSSQVWDELIMRTLSMEKFHYTAAYKNICDNRW